MNNDIRRVVQRWWQRMYLSPDELKKVGMIPAPNSQKAQLKRCESIDSAMLSEGFRALWLSQSEEIINQGHSKDIECWATIAAALVYVKKDSDVHLATAAGKKNDSDKSVVSELRFAQLQNAKTPDDFLRRLRRILQQIDGATSVVNLATDIEQWFSEHYQFQPLRAEKRIAVKWAMEYYQAAK